MLFPQTVEYALRTVVFLASEANGTSTTPRIATATQVPLAYLAKVVQSLRKARIVRCVRGVGGGVVLDRKLGEMSIYDVVEAVEPIQRIRRCPLGLAAHQEKLCPLHAIMDRALAEMERRFRQMTVEELMGQGGLALNEVVDLQATVGKRTKPAQRDSASVSRTRSKRSKPVSKLIHPRGKKA
jgi:Rrf2 family transcriptional regulator, nitric oxide-sensitive transcriptional repressor